MRSIPILPSRRDLASLLDCTTETLSRSLHRRQDMGLIKLVTPERIEIRDPAGLGRMAGPQEGLCAALLQMQAQENGAQGPSTCRASSFPAAARQLDTAPFPAVHTQALAACTAIRVGHATFSWGKWCAEGTRTIYLYI